MSGKTRFCKFALAFALLEGDEIRKVGHVAAPIVGDSSY
jgi:hypothetical protein